MAPISSSVLEHRHGNERSEPAKFDDATIARIAVDIGLLCREIGDVD